MKCPQCVASSLTSFVVFNQPLSDVNNNTAYYDPQGNFKRDSTHNVLTYTCSQNHTGILVRPADPI